MRVMPQTFQSPEQAKIAALAFEFRLARGVRNSSFVNDLFRAADAMNARTARGTVSPTHPFLIRTPTGRARGLATDARTKYEPS